MQKEATDLDIIPKGGFYEVQWAFCTEPNCAFPSSVRTCFKSGRKGPQFWDGSKEQQQHDAVKVKLAKSLPLLDYSLSCRLRAKQKHTI